MFYELIIGESLFGSGDSPLPVVMKRHLNPLVLPQRWPEGVPAGVDLGVDQSTGEDARGEICERWTIRPRPHTDFEGLRARSNLHSSPSS